MLGVERGTAEANALAPGPAINLQDTAAKPGDAPPGELAFSAIPGAT